MSIDDQVNHPKHYAEGRQYEPIDVIRDWDLGFNLGNVVKYISRAGRKDSELQDLKKAQWYLNDYISNLEQETMNEKLASGLPEGLPYEVVKEPKVVEYSNPMSDPLDKFKMDLDYEHDGRIM